MRVAVYISIFRPRRDRHTVGLRPPPPARLPQTLVPARPCLVASLASRRRPPLALKPDIDLTPKLGLYLTLRVRVRRSTGLRLAAWPPKDSYASDRPVALTSPRRPASALLQDRPPRGPSPIAAQSVGANAVRPANARPPGLDRPLEPFRNDRPLAAPSLPRSDGDRTLERPNGHSNAHDGQEPPVGARLQKPSHTGRRRPRRPSRLPVRPLQKSGLHVALRARPRRLACQITLRRRKLVEGQTPTAAMLVASLRPKETCLSARPGDGKTLAARQRLKVLGPSPPGRRPVGRRRTPVFGRQFRADVDSRPRLAPRRYTPSPVKTC